MTVLTIHELEAPYVYVASEQALADVTRLLEVVPKREGSTSVVLSATGHERGRSILELEGLGKEIWEGVDPRKYIDELRADMREREVVPPAAGDPAERRRRLVELVAWMRSNPLSPGAPRMTREDFHERR